MTRSSANKWPKASDPPGPLAGSKLTEQRLRYIYSLLFSHFGSRNWWPGESPFEVMVGAVLTQNTAWRNVEKAILNLAQEGLLSPEAIGKADLQVLAKCLKPSGYFNVKAGRLKNLVDFILRSGRGGLKPQVLLWPLPLLREGLLAVKGIGPETADSIVLYAAEKPSFVVDAYTRRILSRHSLADGDEDYEDIRAWFMHHLTPDVPLYNQYHALIVGAGHHFCSPKEPKCLQCPLQSDPLLKVSKP